jgi:glycosyltransferase involved in cell wall biosynthesis
MRVLGFGTYDTRRHPRAGILLTGLQERGHVVQQLNVPLGFSTAERVDLLARPWTAGRFVTRMVRAWAILAFRALHRPGEPRPEVVLVGYMGHFDVVLARLLFPRSAIVLDHLISGADTAADRGLGGGVKQRLLAGLDKLATACAGIVVVDTEEHLDRLPPSAREKAVVVPVGAPPEWFDATTERSGYSDLRAVFFGLFTPLQGAVVIGRALSRLAGQPVRVTMVGHGQDAEAARTAAGDGPAEWLDWVDPVDLPPLVAGHHVCLGIFGTTPKAQRVVPNKVFQGAAAGCCIVTSDTPPQRRVLGDAAVFVPPGDDAGLAVTLSGLAGSAEMVSEMGRRAQALAERSFRPAAVVEPLHARLQDLRVR